MIRLCQRDPKWAAKKLGSGPMTIGQKGCTTTALSMGTDYFGKYMAPDKIANHPGWYTDKNHKDGPCLILWTKLVIPGVKFDLREFGQKDKNIQAALLDPKQVVLLQVNKGAHWVLAVHSLGNGDYIVADPWTGKDCDVKATYFNITGAAYFSKV